MTEPPDFLDASEAARFRRLDEDLRVWLRGFLGTARSMRPDLNQPGMFGDLLTAIERREGGPAPLDYPVSEDPRR